MSNVPSTVFTWTLSVFPRYLCSPGACTRVSRSEWSREASPTYRPATLTTTSRLSSRSMSALSRFGSMVDRKRRRSSHTGLWNVVYCPLARPMCANKRVQEVLLHNVLRSNRPIVDRRHCCNYKSSNFLDQIYRKDINWSVELTNGLSAKTSQNDFFFRLKYATKIQDANVLIF